MTRDLAGRERVGGVHSTLTQVEAAVAAIREGGLVR